jgi:hypothetical protein
MNSEEARARAHALLTVIESAYAIEVVNREEVINAVVQKTRDEQQILSICTVLNTWVALNADVSGRVMMPLAVVEQVAATVLGRPHESATDRT